MKDYYQAETGILNSKCGYWGWIIGVCLRQYTLGINIFDLSMDETKSETREYECWRTPCLSLSLFFQVWSRDNNKQQKTISIFILFSFGPAPSIFALLSIFIQGAVVCPCSSSKSWCWWWGTGRVCRCGSRWWFWGQRWRRITSYWSIGTGILRFFGRNLVGFDTMFQMAI